MQMHKSRRGSRLARRRAMGWLVLPAANRTLRRRRPAQHSRSTELAALGLGSAAGYAASRLTRRRRHVARDRAAATARHAAHDTARRTRFAAGFVKGAAHAVTSPLRPPRSYDDVTLARKVETELFRPADAPKGTVDINCVNGIVEMRGRVDDPAKSEELAAAAERIEGVKGVRNLLRVGQPV